MASLPSAERQTITPAALYDQLTSQLRSLLAGERDFIANAANFSALLYHSLPDVNWVGFYLHEGRRAGVGTVPGESPLVFASHWAKASAAPRPREDRQCWLITCTNFPAT